MNFEEHMILMCRGITTCATGPTATRCAVRCETFARPSKSLLWPAMPPMSLDPSTHLSVSGIAHSTLFIRPLSTRRGTGRMGAGGAFQGAERIAPRKMDSEGRRLIRTARSRQIWQ